MAFLLDTPIGRFHTSLEANSHFHLVKQVENFWKGGIHLRGGGRTILAGDWINRIQKNAAEFSRLMNKHMERDSDACNNAASAALQSQVAQMVKTDMS